MMKHILVPTDFSAYAAHALDAAVMLAKRFDASIHLFTNLELPNNWSQLTETERAAFPGILENIRESEAKQEALKSKHAELSITSSYAGGKLIDAIKTTIEEKNIDFVVMGSHGSSGISEIFIGSNTQKVVRLIHRPVLIVKGPLKDISFKRIVFASNFNLAEKKSFLYFKNIIADFEPEILLLGIKTSFFFDAPVSATQAAMESFKNLAAPFPCRTFIFKNANIEGGIRDFAKQVGADLIAISNHNRTPLRRMLIGSNVEALINHSDLPVLSIDYE